MDVLDVVAYAFSIVIFGFWMFQWLVHTTSIFYGSRILHHKTPVHPYLSIRSTTTSVLKSTSSLSSSASSSSLLATTSSSSPCFPLIFSFPSSSSASSSSSQSSSQPPSSSSPPLSSSPSLLISTPKLPASSLSSLSSSSSSSSSCLLQGKKFVGVSVLKPLTGIDSALHENLESFFKQDYPKYELLFCVENEFDASVKLVKGLISKYPTVDAKLFMKAKSICMNPKINNMLQGYTVAKYPLVLISDSGIKMYSDTLTQMVSLMDEKTCLIHQMPYMCDKPDFARIVEKVYFGTQHAKVYLVADLLGINCITGMSCLFKKYILDAHGGLEVFGNYLAEDYHIGRVLLESGLRSRLCYLPAQQNIGNCSISAFHNRMKRWIQLHMSLVPFTIIIEPLSECLVLGVLASLASMILFKWSGLVFFCVHSLIWFLLDYKLLTIVQGTKGLPFTKMDFMFGWLFRELTSFYVILRAIQSRSITWRSRKFRLKWWGVGEEIKDGFYV